MTSHTTGNLRPESLRPPDRRPVVRGFLLDMGMPARLPSNVTVTTAVSASNSNRPPTLQSARESPPPARPGEPTFLTFKNESPPKAGLPAWAGTQLLLVCPGHLARLWRTRSDNKTGWASFEGTAGAVGIWYWNYLGACTRILYALYSCTTRTARSTGTKLKKRIPSTSGTSLTSRLASTGSQPGFCCLHARCAAVFLRTQPRH